MLPLEVVFEVPSEIFRGLATGALERVGGVIRESGSKKVVAWLREGGRIADNPNLADGFLRSFLNVGSGGLTNAGFGALDLVVSSHRHNQVMQQLMRLERLQVLSAGIGVANIAVSALSLAILLKRLNKLESKIDGLYEYIREEIRASKEAELNAAIDATQNAFNMKHFKNKEWQAHNAIDHFNKVRSFMLADLGKVLKESAALRDRAFGLVQAIEIDSMLTRVHLEIDELDSAKYRVDQSVDEHHSRVREMVGICLGDDRQAYFLDTEAISTDDLKRFVAIEDWLHGRDDEWKNNTDDSPLMKVLDKYRESLRNTKLFPTQSDGGLRARTLRQNEEAIVPPVERLLCAELLIEKYEGLEGLQAELKAIASLSATSDGKWNQWQDEQSKALKRAKINLAEHNDYVLLVDEEYHNSLKRLNAQ